MNNIICGVLKKKRKFYFTFDADNKILTIQPPKMGMLPSFIPEDDFDDFSLSKERMNISGETNNRNYIEFIEVKFSSIGRGCFELGFLHILLVKQMHYLLFQNQHQLKAYPLKVNV